MNHPTHLSETSLDNAIDQAFIAASRRDFPGAPRNLVIEEFLMTQQQRTHTRRSLSSRARTRLLVWLGIGTVAVGGVAYGAKQASEPATSLYRVALAAFHVGSQAVNQPEIVITSVQTDLSTQPDLICTLNVGEGPDGDAAAFSVGLRPLADGSGFELNSLEAPEGAEQQDIDVFLSNVKFAVDKKRAGQ